MENCSGPCPQATAHPSRFVKLMIPSDGFERNYKTENTSTVDATEDITYRRDSSKYTVKLYSQLPPRTFLRTGHR